MGEGLVHTNFGLPSCEGTSLSLGSLCCLSSQIHVNRVRIRERNLKTARNQSSFRDRIGESADFGIGFIYRNPMPLYRRRLLLLCPAVLLCSFALSQTPALIPMPRNLKSLGDQTIPHGVRIVCASCLKDSEDQYTAEDLRQTLKEREIPASEASGMIVRLERLAARPDPGFTEAMKPEGYTINSTPTSIVITGATPQGLFYGVQTLKQMIERTDSAAPVPSAAASATTAQAVFHAANIVDWPAMKWRGVSDDLSRGPVPTLEFQKKQIRTFASYKINLYSPYFEHTQRYASNPLFAPPGGSISASDARELVAYAAKYHITIVPDQEAFGHLHHNLTWEQYSALAETPHGEVLAPVQSGSVEVIKQMFTELAGLYPGPFLHLGADETVDLGMGQTKPDVDAQGLGAVYLDFLQRIVTALHPIGRKLLFWGDIAMDSPDLVKALPQSFKDSTIAVAWEYNPHPHGFEKYLIPYTQAGMETWVASGVNNWSRVYPNNNFAMLNIQGFVRDGQRLGSTGLLNTIWDDDGEGLEDSDWYGLLFGAAAGWQMGESSIPQFENSYGAAFHGDTTGKLNEAQKEMMQAHNVLHDEAKTGDGSDGLFWLDPLSKDGQNYAAKLRPYTHDLRLHAERAITLIAEARAANPNLRESDAIDALELGARRMDFIGLKFQLADEIAAGYERAYTMQATTDKKQRANVARELSGINGVNGRIADIRDTYSLLRDLYAQAWLRTNRPYGLRPVLEHYDYTVGLWLARADKLRSAQRQWSDTHTLPPAADLGLPLPPH